MWGELASRKRLFNPPSQFSRLGILVSSSALCFLMALTIVQSYMYNNYGIVCIVCLGCLSFLPTFT